MKWPQISEMNFRIVVFLLVYALWGSLLPILPAQQSSEQNGASPIEDYADADAYRIYAVLLETEKGSSFVIRAETDSWDGITTENLEIRGDTKFMKLWGAAMKDFVSRFRTPKLLGKKLPLTASYELVPERTINSFFKHEQGWTTFTGRYPSAYGYYTFSAAGFNPQRNKAIVWMTFLCGGLCGHGTYHFFEKRSGRWREVSVKAELSGINF